MCTIIQMIQFLYSSICLCILRAYIYVCVNFGVQMQKKFLLTWNFLLLLIFIVLVAVLTSCEWLQFFTLIKYIPTQRQNYVYFFSDPNSLPVWANVYVFVHMSVSFFSYNDILSIYVCVFTARLFAICCFNIPHATELNQISFEIMLHLQCMKTNVLWTKRETQSISRIEKRKWNGTYRCIACEKNGF